MLRVSLLFLLFKIILSEKCATPNGEESDCIPIKQCNLFVNGLLDLQPVSVEFIQKSQCGRNSDGPLVCCGTQIAYTTPPPKSAPNKMDLLPSNRYCGYQHFDDYLHAGNTTVSSIHEFPWLAALVYKVKNNQSKIQCAGSLISNRYVLTAGHCFVASVPLIGVRLGEYDIQKNSDCVKDDVEEECTDELLNFEIEETIIHPQFIRDINLNDIGLIRLNQTVVYSDYVRPICLPLPGTKLAEVGEQLLISGWGFPNKDLYNQVAVKKKILAKYMHLQRCVDRYKAISYTFINEKQICTSSDESVSDISCAGDSGSAVMYSNNRNQWHIEGVVSFGMCGSNPITINTNVVKYLDWIVENIRK